MRLSLTLCSLLVISYVKAAPQPGTTKNVDLLMPKVKPQQPDTYLCRATRVEDAHMYIREYIPKADSTIAHHILLYGCLVPGAPEGEVWDCGEMSASTSSYIHGSVCQEGTNILYAWAMEAPRLNLPEDVSFDVGQDTPVKYLVIQVHYKNVTKFLSPQNGEDSSGLTLQVTNVPTSKQAGVYLMETDGYIPAHSIEYFETACNFDEDVEIVPFAYRTHAHALGRVISGYRIRDGEWKEIGRKDPRLPEMFYNVTNQMTIRKGDILAARCTMENTLDHGVAIGPTQNDEMCNFYIMYYVNNPPILMDQSCDSMGPPRWYWKDFTDQQRLNLKGAPDTISVIPGTEKPLIRNVTEADEDTYGDVVVGVPGQFENVRDEDIIDEAVHEMSPEDLLSVVHQLASMEEEGDTRNQMWQEQLGRQQNMNADSENGSRLNYIPDYANAVYRK